MKTLIIDHYDSFSYNIYQMVAEINGVEPLLIQHDAIDYAGVSKLDVDNIIIAPGPGTPLKEKDFSVSKEILLHSDKPILGICLGHQGIASVYGGKVLSAKVPSHGQVTSVKHNGDPLFQHIPEEFQVVRYHSLQVCETLSEVIELTAWTKEGTVMGLKHRDKPIWGLQFHPESISTEQGHWIFKNFKALTEQRLKNKKCIRVSASIQPKEQVTQIKPYSISLHTVSMPLDFAEIYSNLYADEEYAVWLDSALLDKRQSSFSVIGCMAGPLSYRLQYQLNDHQIQICKNGIQTTVSQNIFDFLEAELVKFQIDDVELPFDFRCGFMGYFGYELKQLSHGLKNRHTSNAPDAQFIFVDRALVYDHAHETLYLLALTESEHQASAELWFSETEQKIKASQSQKRADLSKTKNDQKSLALPVLERNGSDYIQDIDQCLNYIHQGESYEICLTNRIAIERKIDPLSYYLTLREINPAPYAAFLRLGELAIVSASIERFLKIDPKGQVESKPIKGTLRRGEDPVSDQALCDRLKTEAKFRSENLMITDLVRHDLGKVCQIGSVKVDSLMEVETYKTVHQLVSTISGALKDKYSAIDCIKACFPGGSMTGAPKLRTLQIIDELEHSARGVYSGALGYLSVNGAVDLSIVIRTAIVSAGQISMGVGGAITALSDPKDEYAEMQLKARSLLEALAEV